MAVVEKYNLETPIELDAAANSGNCVIPNGGSSIYIES